jgi:preprotein translocase subunit SecD
MRAGLYGALLVMFFMLFVYRLAGVNSLLALWRST